MSSDRDELIFMVCMGNRHYRTMAKVCIESLRSVGNYRGDIVVFADRQLRLGDNRVTVDKVGASKDEYPVHILSKAFVGSGVDTSIYKKIMLIDVDCMAVSDVNPLFDFRTAAARGAIEKPFSTMLWRSMGAELMTPTERVKARYHWGINTGLLCWPSSIFEDNVSLWQNEIVERADRLNEWADQPFFNYLVFKDKIRFKPYPDRWVEFPGHYGLRCEPFKVSRETKVLHLWGLKPEYRANLMVNVLEDLQEKTSLRTLSENITQFYERSNVAKYV